jgi:hypothetical protein
MHQAANSKKRNEVLHSIYLLRYVSQYGLTTLNTIRPIYLISHSAWKVRYRKTVRIKIDFFSKPPRLKKVPNTGNLYQLRRLTSNSVSTPLQNNTATNVKILTITVTNLLDAAG